MFVLGSRRQNLRLVIPDCGVLDSAWRRFISRACTSSGWINLGNRTMSHGDVSIEPATLALGDSSLPF